MKDPPVRVADLDSYAAASGLYGSCPLRSPFLIREHKNILWTSIFIIRMQMRKLMVTTRDISCIVSCSSVSFMDLTRHVIPAIDIEDESSCDTLNNSMSYRCFNFRQQIRIHSLGSIMIVCQYVVYFSSLRKLKKLIILISYVIWHFVINEKWQGLNCQDTDRNAKPLTDWTVWVLNDVKVVWILSSECTGWDAMRHCRIDGSYRKSTRWINIFEDISLLSSKCTEEYHRISLVLYSKWFDQY